MISKERLEELESYFWDESNDEDTQTWRDDLNDEEQKLIMSGMKNTLKDLLIFVKKY